MDAQKIDGRYDSLWQSLCECGVDLSFPLSLQGFMQFLGKGFMTIEFLWEDVCLGK